MRGRWTDYHVSFTWMDDIEALHIACAFDLKVPEARRQEVLRLLNREEQEGQPVVRQLAKAMIGEPDRVGQAHHHRLVMRDHRVGAEDRVAKAGRRRLHDEDGGGLAAPGNLAALGS